MAKVDDLVEKAERAVQRAQYFSRQAKQRYAQLAKLKGGSKGGDSAEAINLLLSILSLSSATEAECYEAKNAAEQLGRAAGRKLSRAESQRLEESVKKAESATRTADDLKAKAEEQLDSGEILDKVTGLIDIFFQDLNTKQRIYERLEGCDALAQKAEATHTSKGNNLVKSSSDMIFIAESLPIIHGIIHVSTTRQSLSQAIKWTRVHWGETANSLIVLSALVFTYIADKGVIDHDPTYHPGKTVSPEKAVIWQRIAKRVKKFTGP